MCDILPTLIMKYVITYFSKKNNWQNIIDAIGSEDKKDDLITESYLYFWITTIIKNELYITFEWLFESY